MDDAVLLATRELLVEVGYSATSIDGVAKRAGVGRPTIYRRWPSKAHMVHEAVFPPVELPPLGDGGLDETIAAIVDGAIAIFAEPAARMAVPGLMMELRADPELEGILAQRIEAAARRQFRDEVMEPASRRGEARRDLDADIVFDALMGAVIVALCIRDEHDLNGLARSLTDLILRGCARPGGGTDGGSHDRQPR